jgi:hypothetical protein
LVVGVKPVILITVEYSKFGSMANANIEACGVNQAGVKRVNQGTTNAGNVFPETRVIEPQFVRHSPLAKVGNMAIN